MAQIRLVNLKKELGSVAALQGVSLTIPQGELLAMLGPSGCGKTTTLQLLAGFLVPDGGEVWADGYLLSSPRGVVPPDKRRMSLVFQSYALWPHMTVFKNVAFGLETRHVPTDQLKERVGRILEVVGLQGYEDRYPHQLSGGQQQRVALARALVVEPDTLLLDEPLSNLDANLREQMRFEIRRIHEVTKITTVYVTHDQAEAMVIADRIAVINRGRIEQIGTPHEIYEAPQSRFVASFIGNANCLPGSVIEPGVVRCGEMKLRANGTEEVHAGDDVVVCIRPHAVRVYRDRPGASAGDNVSAGRLVQYGYLGDLQDLRIALPGGAQIRALAPSGRDYSPGEEVFVELPIDGCRVMHA